MAHRLLFLSGKFIYMDRNISKSEKQKRKFRQFLKIGIWFLIFVIAIMSLRFIIQPSIERDEFHTSFIEHGDIEASVTASGTVLPEFEEIKISPVQSRIIKIYHNTGDKVKQGDSILSLDKKSTLSSLEKLKDELNVKRNNVTKLRLKLEKDLIDLRTKHEIEKLEVENLETELEEEEYLDMIGGGTKEKIKKARLLLKISRLELKQISQNIINLEQSMQADLLGLNYEINIQQKNVNELQDKLNRTTIIADNEGVITWINDQIGKNVNAGEELVKIANLQSYEVTGSISDMHAEKLAIGRNVIIRINEKNEIRGEIASISPSVKGSIIQFKVKLEEKDHPLLRPNLKVDVFVITSFRKGALRLKNGAFYKGGSKQFVYVLRENKLVQKQVALGESNFYYVEVLNGLKEGDEIVISDLSDYERHQEIKIKTR